MSEARATLRHGLLALAKSALLVAGVPASLIRLWYLSPTPSPLGGRSIVASPAAWVHVLILIAAGLWAWAAMNLVREVLAAVRHVGRLPKSSWSARWAGGIAGLVLMATAGSAAATSAVTVALQHGATSLSIVAPARETSPLTVDDQNVSATAVLGPGEGLADLADRATGRRAAWQAITRANLDLVQNDGGRFVDPNLVRTGWRLVIPETLPHEDAEPTLRRDEVGALAPADHTLEEAALFGLGILATAALVRRLRTLRRLAESTRDASERLMPFGRELGWVDALTSPLGTSTLLEWIDAALRLVTMVVDATAAASTPDIELVRAGPDGVEFLLSQPRPNPPAPFIADTGGHWWRLDPSLSLAEARAAGKEFGRFVPWLVPVGDDGDAVYLVAVGPGRRLVIDGDRPAVRAVLAGLSAALRVLPWAEELEVELLGLPSPPPEEQCYQLVASSAATLEALAHAPLASERRVLRPRWRREQLVLVGEASEPECPDDVLDRVQPVAGVIAPRGTGTARLVLTVGGATLEPFGIELLPIQPQKGQLDLVERLLAAACARAEIVSLDRPPALPARDETSSAGPWGVIASPGRVEVRLLTAAPAVVGLVRLPATRDRDRVVELLAYLSLHGHAAARQEIAQAMFAREDEAGRALRLANAVAATRGALPPRADGASALSPLTDPELRLDPLVSSDWRRCSDAISRARVAPPDAAVALLRGALELVQTEDESLLARSYDWIAAEGLRDAIGAEIVDAAHHLATLALAAGDVLLARWAIAKGRFVEPASEMLVRDLLVALDASGELEGLNAVFRNLEHALADLGGSEPSPETRALFDHLTTKRSSQLRARAPGP